MCRISDGANFHLVVDIAPERRTTQVIDVCFETENALVLAWFSTSKRSGSRSLRSEEAVACFGREVADRLTLACGDILGSKPLPSGQFSRLAMAHGRARSAGAHGNPRSSWSFGTRHHDDQDPSRCPGICTRHRLFMSLEGGLDVSPRSRPINEASAIDCDGVSCCDTPKEASRVNRLRLTTCAVGFIEQVNSESMASRPSQARPCKEGAACKYCHARHPE